MDETYFSLWKAKAITYLAMLGIKAIEEENQKLFDDINVVITKLRTARRRDLVTILADLWEIYRYHKLPEILKLFPTPEEEAKLLREEEED